MYTLTLNSFIKHNNKKTSLPTTARGRALYTIDWFINGSPVLTNHDNPRVSLRNEMRCC